MPVPPPPYTDLLHAVTLGTARRGLSAEVSDWIDELGATDPTADEAERLLAALAIRERIERLQPQQTLLVTGGSDAVAEESRTAPGAKLARGLQLILGGTYSELLDEGVDLVLERDTYVPAPLLPALLLRAAALVNDDFNRAKKYVRAGGMRGTWLAAQNPEWEGLVPGYDFQKAWRIVDQPAQRANLLARWRSVDANAAREALAKIWSGQSPRNQKVLLEGMRVNLTAADHSWLLEQLAPKRKGVRRTLTELLAAAGEESTMEDLDRLATEIIGPRGDIRQAVSTEEAREVLERYGGVKTPQTVDQWLLEIMPPRTWEKLTSMKPATFWLSLKPLQLRAVGRAIVAFPDLDEKVVFVDFLLREHQVKFPADLAVELIRQLPEATFERLYGKLLTDQSDALRLRGMPRLLALSRRSHWSERLSKAMINRLLDDLRSRQLDYATQRDLGLHWKLATPLLHPDIFPWLRQQLHAATERYDAFGKLATAMLQTTAFRRELRRS
ncbi:hypothetical protein GGR28_003290 [Lewinella aquimaris]|uniref:Uncharacterized protein n=1 Tax=Neolewinella aquimaris TaxID=1835722 RepID=A0A840EAT1_9BACT|nr:DUF5691 domain-containing protein [Neolewinella aquimaris]MBB4080655.1 hypothetical protein [Neolewinella aquimaris]